VVLPLARRLTPELRAELGLQVRSAAPYRWGFATLLVGVACLPMLLAKMWTFCVLAVLIGLVVLPTVRWFEQRDAAWRDEVYRMGGEATGKILDVEPASHGKADHLVRVEFRAGSATIRTSVIGCPLARRGLAPDDDVVIYYARERPTRCIIARKAAPRVVDAVFD
jgi:hypothetical protein